VLGFSYEDQCKNGTLTRREWLRIGGVAGLGLSLPKPGVANQEVSAFGSRSAKSVIVVFTSGGQSHLDLWDPKPDAPREIRGEFQPIPTSAPGTFLCEHMPRIAKLADRFTIVRSMSHEDLDHGSAFYLSMTGQYHARSSSNPQAKPTDHPAFSSVYKLMRPAKEFIDSAIHLNAPAIVAPNTIAPGQFGGFLGRDYDPMVVGDVTEGPIVIPGLTPHPDLPQVRLKTRQTLLQAIEGQQREWERDRRMDDMQTLYRRAFELLDDPQTRDAFNLAAEPEALRNRYGTNRSGQACLLARRLVEAGVPLITVIWNHRSRGQDMYPGKTDFYGWDTHNDIFESLGNHLLPRFDQGFSALLEDLDDRGLLDETLVICMGEFGRAPLVALEPRFAGATPGRKHWAAVYSILAAGAGVSRGKVLGHSDRIGAYPASEKYAPWDVTATIFSALGVDPSGHFTDSIGRNLPLSLGHSISGLYV
jgi:hypothetical protein